MTSTFLYTLSAFLGGLVVGVVLTGLAVRSDPPAPHYTWADPIIVSPKSEVTVTSPYHTSIETSETGHVAVTVQPLDEAALLAKLARTMQHDRDINEADRPLPRFSRH